MVDIHIRLDHVWGIELFFGWTRMDFNAVYSFMERDGFWDMLPLCVYFIPAFFTAVAPFNSMQMVGLEVAISLSGFDLTSPRQYSDGLLVYQSM